MLNGILENAIVFGFLTIFSFGLLIISALSYKRSKNKKIIFINLVFILFLLKGILLSLSVFLLDLQDCISITILAILDLLILLLLFFAVLKKQ